MQIRFSNFTFILLMLCLLGVQVQASKNKHILKSNISYKVLVSIDNSCVYSNMVDDTFYIKYTKNPDVKVDFNPELSSVTYDEVNIVNIPVSELISVEGQEKNVSLLSLLVKESYPTSKAAFEIGILILHPEENPDTAAIIEGKAIIYKLLNSNAGFSFEEQPFSGKLNANSTRLYCNLDHTGAQIIYQCACEYSGNEKRQIINF